MGIGREFLISIRIMTHTLVDHMLSFFPDPWRRGPSRQETGEAVATTEELMELANELEYLYSHTQKLTKQISRSYDLLRTGIVNCTVPLEALKTN